MSKEHYLKRVKFVKVFLDIKKDYELSPSQSLLYGYLYNHCMELNDAGYCGYSNEHMADLLGTKLATFKNDLKALVEKDLIYIKNAGSRSKKKGESREIHINEKVFLTEDTVKALDEAEQLRKENDALKKTIEALNNRLEQLDNTTSVTPTVWSKKLVTYGYISKDEYNEAPSDYNDLMEAFIRSIDYDLAYLEKAIKYLAKVTSEKTIYSKVAYLETFITDSSLHKIIKEAPVSDDFRERYDF